MRFILLISILCVSVVFNSFSQRIKYKNVFPLLQSKDYKSAEPLLLKFLEENDDEANAYFYLGEIIVSKLDTVEIFPSSEKYDSLSNLAVSSYKKAIALVDDREVRKNDEYYMAYNRRDLRTGKFGIKTSDVHLDYENKIADVSARKELIHELHQLKTEVIGKYDKFKKEVEEFYSAYPDEPSFMLRATSDDRKALNEIRSSFSDFTSQYSTFADKLNSLNHPLYTAELKLTSISKWEELAPKEIDFSDFKVEIQNYDNYLNQVDSKIESEVRPIKALLFKTDSDFNSALNFNKGVEDTTAIKDMVIPEELEKGLRQLDNKNVVLDLLHYKRLKNRSTLLTNSNLFPVLNDSTNIFQRTNVFKKYKSRLADQLEVIKSIESKIDERTKLDFANYFAGYQPSIEAYINTEKTILEKKYEEVAEKSKKWKLIFSILHLKRIPFILLH